MKHFHKYVKRSIAEGCGFEHEVLSLLGGAISVLQFICRFAAGAVQKLV